MGKIEDNQNQKKKNQSTVKRIIKGEILWSGEKYWILECKNR